MFFFRSTIIILVTVCTGRLEREREGEREGEREREREREIERERESEIQRERKREIETSIKRDTNQDRGKWIRSIFCLVLFKTLSNALPPPPETTPPPPPQRSSPCVHKAAPLYAKLYHHL